MILVLSLPLRGASPNETSSRHWRERASAAKTMRNEAWAVALKEIPAERRRKGHQKPITIYSEFHYGKTIDQRYRPKDKANAIGAIKPYIDGLVDAGLVPDDTHEWVSWGRVDIFPDSPKAAVILTIVEDAS